MKPSVVILFTALALGSCGSFPTQSDVQQSLTATQSEVHQLKATLAAQQAASTQPGGLAAPDPKLVKAVNDLATKVDTITTASTQPGALTPSGVGAIVGGTVGGPIGGWLAVIGAVIGWGFGLYQQMKAKQNAQNLATTADGLQAAINTGAISVTPNAPQIVNAAVTDHPSTSAIVDMLSDASKTARIVA